MIGSPLYWIAVGAGVAIGTGMTLLFVTLPMRMRYRVRLDEMMDITRITMGVHDTGEHHWDLADRDGALEQSQAAYTPLYPGPGRDPEPSWVSYVEEYGNRYADRGSLREHRVRRPPKLPSRVPSRMGELSHAALMWTGGGLVPAAAPEVPDVWTDWMDEIPLADLYHEGQHRQPDPTEGPDVDGDDPLNEDVIEIRPATMPETPDPRDRDMALRDGLQYMAPWRAVAGLHLARLRHWGVRMETSGAHVNAAMFEAMESSGRQVARAAVGVFWGVVFGWSALVESVGGLPSPRPMRAKRIYR